MRNTAGLIPWVAGQSGNPSGRPKNPLSRKELAPYKQKILDALLAALADPLQRIEALQIATVYLWGKPTEFDLSEEVNELESALAAVDTMSVEQLEKLVKQ